jgi:DNA-binding SARP family transcriptional activator/tetratricopeptide (TPR) repeat protein
MIEFHLLGRFRLIHDDVEADLGPSRQRCVLAALLHPAGQRVTTEALIERVWGAEPPRTRDALYVYLTRLRRILRPLGVTVDGRAGGYLCRIGDGSVDLDRFTELTRYAAQATDAATRAVLLRKALGLWQGEPLGGLTGDWAQRTRERLRQQWMSAVLARYDAELELGNHKEAVSDLSALVEQHPQVEPLAGQLMLALHRSGRHVEALEVYRQVRKLLVAEQGLEPGPALRALERAVLTNDPALAAPVLLRARSASAPTLPSRVADFTGRHAELATLDAIFDKPRVAPALCVLHGVGGAGKTALALHWAHLRAPEFPDGVLYLDLGTAGDRGGQDLLHALGVRDADIPAEPVRQQALLRRRLTGRQLVILDNATSAGQIRALLPADGQVMVLVLARIALEGLTVHERASTIPVGPLLMADAVALLRQFDGGADDTAGDKYAELARLCDRLPLALRIAGCRLSTNRGITVDGLLADLAPEDRRLAVLEIDGDDAGVRAAFAAAYRWMGPDAAAAFRLTGSLPGAGLSGPAAAWALATSPDRARHLLDELAHHQVVHIDDGVYRMHDLVRLFARQQSQRQDSAADRLAALDRLGHFYLDTGYAARRMLDPGPVLNQRDYVVDPPPHPPLRHADADAARAWFATHRRDIAAAVHALHEYGLHARAAQLAEVVMVFYHQQRLWFDWLELLGTAKRAAAQGTDTWLRMRISHGLGIVQKLLGRTGAAIDAYHEALEFAENIGDPIVIGPIHANLGALYNTTGDAAMAKHHLEAALALPGYREDTRYSPILYLNLGHLCFNERAFARAAELLELGLRDAARSNHRHGTAYLHHGLGEVEFQRTRDEAAIDHAERALTEARRLADPLREAYALDLLASVTALGDLDAAVLLWDRALRATRRLGHPLATSIEQLLAEDLPAEPVARRRLLTERRFAVNRLP